MSNVIEFVAGDLVFEVSDPRISLGRVFDSDDEKFRVGVTSSQHSYLPNGCYSTFGTPSLFRATTENRAALVTLYGEDAVPRLPLRGSELTKKLLETQKYVLCRVSDKNDDDARGSTSLHVTHKYDSDSIPSFKTLGCGWHFAVPVDPITGEEITDWPDANDSAHNHEPDLKVNDILRCSIPCGDWFEAGARYRVAETDEGLAMIDGDGDTWNYKGMRGRHFVFGHDDAAHVAFEKD